MMIESIITSSILVFLSLLLWIATKIIKNTDFTDLIERVKLWWGMLVIFLLSNFVSPVISIISLGLLCFFSLKEFYNMKQIRKNEKKLHYWAYLAIPLQFYWIYDGWYGMFIVFIPIFTLLFLPLARILAGGTVGFLKSVSSTHWGLMLMVFGLSHLAFYPKLDAEWGSKMVLYVVVLTQLNDVAQYLVSKTLGKKKIADHVNPNMTWEGFAFGLFSTTAASIFLSPYLIPMELFHSILAGLLIAFAGFVGTLNIAYLKRDLQMGEENKVQSVKNSFLSKIDSLTYTAPVFLHFIRYFSDFF